MRAGAIHRWLGGAVVLLIAAEIALRVVLGLGHPLLMGPNPIYGYMPAPDQDLHRFFSHIHINAYGMRSDNIEASKPPGKKRILFSGDSVLFGTTYLDQAVIFTSRLQRDLGPGTEVMNASVGGWAPSNELGFLKAKGTFGADLVVFVLNTKDLTQPFAGFEENALNPAHNPPTALGELLERYVAPRIFKGLAVHDPGSIAEGDPAIETETPKILATLSEAHRIASDHGAHFAIIFSPSVGEDVTKYQRHWDKGVSMLMDWAKSENVSIIDMRRDYAAHPSKDVFIDGIHLKPLGHELMEKAFLQKYRAGQL
jgi:hypothetical protein